MGPRVDARRDDEVDETPRDGKTIHGQFKAGGGGRVEGVFLVLVPNPQLLPVLPVVLSHQAILKEGEVSAKAGGPAALNSRERAEHAKSGHYLGHLDPQRHVQNNVEQHDGPRVFDINRPLHLAHSAQDVVKVTVRDEASGKRDTGPPTKEVKHPEQAGQGWAGFHVGAIAVSRTPFRR
jgi:hypothetical protein